MYKVQLEHEKEAKTAQLQHEKAQWEHEKEVINMRQDHEKLENNMQREHEKEMKKVHQEEINAILTAFQKASAANDEGWQKTVRYSTLFHSVTLFTFACVSFEFTLHTVLPSDLSCPLC
jgi:molecular chaperone GrpE (heat shock protein)